jgi:tape measure domain-containing protein
MSDDLGAMVVRYTADISDLQSKMTTAQGAVRQAASAAEDSGNSIGNSFTSAGSSLMSFVQNAAATVFSVQTLASTAFNAAQAFLAPASAAENTQLAFTTLMHSASGAKQEMQTLNDFAAGTPMQTTWVDSAAEKLLAFGFSTTDLIPDITAMGDSLSGLGKLSDASLGQMVDIFGKINASGKLTAVDMMQLSDIGVPAWKELASSMGVSVPTLQAMVSKGLVPASVALQGLQKGMEGTFGGGMKAQANTFTGLMSTLSSNWNIAMAAIGGPTLKLAETALSGMGAILSSPAFANFATTVGQDIATVFSDIGTVINTDVVPAFKNVGPLIGAIGQWFYKLDLNETIAAFQKLGTNLTDLVQPLQGLEGPASALMSSFFNNIGPVILTDILPPFNSFINAMGDFVGWLNKGGPMVDLLKDSVVALGIAWAGVNLTAFLMDLPMMLTGIGAWAAEQWGVAAATIATEWPIYAIIAAVALLVVGVMMLVQHWSAVVAFIQGAWKSAITWLTDSIKIFTDYWSAQWGIMLTRGQELIGSIGNAVKTGFQNILNIVLAPINKIVDGFNWLYNHNYYFQELVDSIKNILTKGWADMVGGWNKAVGTVVNTLNDFKNKVGGVFTDIGTALKNSQDKQNKDLASGWQQASKTTSSAWSTIWGYTKDGASKVGQVFNQFWATYIQPGLNAAWTDIQNIFKNWSSSAGSWGAALIQGFMDGLTGQTGNLIASVQGMMSSVAANMGFHSPTKEGPGKELNVWGPNMVKGFTQGIDNASPLLKASIQHLMQPVGQLGYPIVPSASGVASAVVASGSSSSSASGSHTTVVELDGMMLAQVVQKHTDQYVRLKLGSKGRSI